MDPDMGEEKGWEVPIVKKGRGLVVGRTDVPCLFYMISTCVDNAMRMSLNKQ